MVIAAAYSRDTHQKDHLRRLLRRITHHPVVLGGSQKLQPIGHEPLCTVRDGLAENHRL